MHYYVPMAEKVEYIPKRGNSKYSWSEWADGETWLLIQGQDYNVSHASIRRAAYAYAVRSGMKVTTEAVDSMTLEDVTGIPLSRQQEAMYVRFEKPKVKRLKKPPVTKKPKRLPRRGIDK